MDGFMIKIIVILAIKVYKSIHTTTFMMIKSTYNNQIFIVGQINYLHAIY